MNKELSLSEMRQVQLNTLLSIDKFCRANNLEYFLCGGSCIGAIRHKGFIPWDDDIDIAMPRPDYERFVSSFADANLKVFTATDPGYFWPFSKVVDTRTVLREINSETIPGIGVFVDVFPIDGLGDEEGEARKTIKRAGRHMKHLTLTYYKAKSGNKIKVALLLALKSFFRHFSKQELKKIKALGTKNEFSVSKYCGVVFGFYGQNEIMLRSFFQDYSLASFEGFEFRVPADYDGYLTRLYGNYMKLPPAEKQITHHSFKAYWREK